MTGPTRWQTRAQSAGGAGYAARFDALEASGADVHGEARLVASFVPIGALVLDAGCGTGRVARRLAAVGYRTVGVDADPGMLEHAQHAAPELTWVLADLAGLDLAKIEPAPFDLAVAAGNVFPLLAPGTEPAVLERLAAHLRPGGLLVAGFGLDQAHLPFQVGDPQAGADTIDLPAYDGFCAAAGFTLRHRWATWDRDPYTGGGYAVSVHARY